MAADNTIVLHDGRVLTIDLYQISIKEYRSIFNTGQAPDEEDALIAKCVGLSLAEYQALPQPDWRRVSREFLRVAREPLDPPNSASASSLA